MIAISSRSCSASSARPPLSYSSTDSWRCLIIFCNTESSSPSPSGGLPSPRAAMSAFLMVELTMRSVDSLRSSLARMASLTALLMSSRSIVMSSRGPQADNHGNPDLGGSRRSDNLVPQPFDHRIRGRLRLLDLWQVPAPRKDHQFRAGDAVGHLAGQRVGDGVVLVAGQDQRRTFDPAQRRPRV